MTYEQNVRAILECNFAETKDEIIDIACQSICELSRWIPVSERLPEKNGRYLVTNNAGEAFNVDWNAWCNGGWLYPNEKPIAWMPLPEPYKAESEE